MAYRCKHGFGECDSCGYCKSRTVICPVCGEEVEETLYRRDEEIVGCENCISTVDIYDYQEEE